MKFLVDAQLPKRLCRLLEDQGHQAIHSLDLPEGNRTTDQELTRLADAESLVLVSKDDDFVVSHLACQEPHKLLFVSTGNIRNTDLCELVSGYLAEIASAFESASYVELTQTLLIIHE